MTGLTRAQVREIDRRAVEEYGVPSIVLMENAGRGAVEVLMRLNPERKPVLVVCGKGNNGGDGFVIARHLYNADWPVRVVLFAEPASLTGDAAVAFHMADRAGIPLRRMPIHRLRPWYDAIRWVIEHQGWLVDALFGIGVSGPVRVEYDPVIGAINKAVAPVLSVDIPSGLDCDTGEPLGVCVRATHTVTFVAPKAGFANPAAAKWLGTVHIAGIGAPRILLSEYGV